MTARTDFDKESLSSSSTIDGLSDTGSQKIGMLDTQKSNLSKVSSKKSTASSKRPVPPPTGPKNGVHTPSKVSSKSKTTTGVSDLSTDDPDTDLTSDVPSTFTMDTMTLGPLDVPKPAASAMDKMMKQFKDTKPTVPAPIEESLHTSSLSSDLSSLEETSDM
eukprot:TRINITY_DN29129_c0_g1_i1.p1 TRINITY_DN29129_c0_g1~~TRINITY_DN29129_c0_g1_i1.p1  ORF type:complete len:162 (+),score=3.38 TRINITY_DN29129_c0_g1_i1:3-488(+)